jgi:hypothetical protein
MLSPIKTGASLAPSSRSSCPSVPLLLYPRNALLWLKLPLHRPCLPTKQPWNGLNGLGCVRPLWPFGQLRCTGWSLVFRAVLPLALRALSRRQSQCNCPLELWISVRVGTHPSYLSYFRTDPKVVLQRKMTSLKLGNVLFSAIAGHCISVIQMKRFVIGYLFPSSLSWFSKALSDNTQRNGWGRKAKWIWSNYEKRQHWVILFITLPLIYSYRNLIRRSVLLRANGHYIPVEAFEMRYFIFSRPTTFTLLTLMPGKIFLYTMPLKRKKRNLMSLLKVCNFPCRSWPI